VGQIQNWVKENVALVGSFGAGICAVQVSSGWLFVVYKYTFIIVCPFLATLSKVFLINQNYVKYSKRTQIGHKTSTSATKNGHAIKAYL
jgi:hypothetical protein